MPTRKPTHLLTHLPSPCLQSSNRWLKLARACLSCPYRYCRTILESRVTRCIRKLLPRGSKSTSPLRSLIALFGGWHGLSSLLMVQNACKCFGTLILALIGNFKFVGKQNNFHINGLKFNRLCYKIEVILTNNSNDITIEKWREYIKEYDTLNSGDRDWVKNCLIWIFHSLANEPVWF
jgi:hypothetical protein